MYVLQFGWYGPLCVRMEHCNIAYAWNTATLRTHGTLQHWVRMEHCNTINYCTGTDALLHC